MEDKNVLQIYVYLPDEGVDVWRPVNAVQVSENVYRIISPNPFTMDEKWEFSLNELVRCQGRVFSDNETRLVACERISGK